jgi:N-acetylglucosaminyl-diphospho-decaprenol L-rhamnosyltransferase
LTSVEEVSVIVAAHNARPYIERTLRELVRTGDEVILVDCASHDGTSAVVREGFPDVQLVQMDINKGYGAALNEGGKAASGAYFLLMIADAWPIGQAVERLLAFATAEPRLGAVGPRLRNADGSLQPSVRGFPTLWRLATEYFFLRRLAPHSRFLNAFYSAQFDHESTRDAEFLVGAVLLVGRQAFEEVEGFDTAFFMFNEEVDLCYRLRRAGWRVVFFPEAEFVHLGGASTHLVWDQMYREQLRSHLRFLQKHHGRQAAERGHRLLLLAMRMRAQIFRGERRRVSRNAADWLASGDTATLLNNAAQRPAM